MPSRSIEWLTEGFIWRTLSDLQSKYSGDPIIVINFNPLGYILKLEAISYFFEDDIIRLSAAIIRSVIKGHPLQDGNKRLGMVLAEAFLALNDVTIVGSDQSYFELALGLASGDIDEKRLLEWLTANTLTEYPTT